MLIVFLTTTNSLVIVVLLFAERADLVQDHLNDRIGLALLGYWAGLTVACLWVAGLNSWTVSNAVLTAVVAYLMWKHRKPRQRKPSRALGWVRDLGHRLVVTPT